MLQDFAGLIFLFWGLHKVDVGKDAELLLVPRISFDFFGVVRVFFDTWLHSHNSPHFDHLPFLLVKIHATLASHLLYFLLLYYLVWWLIIFDIRKHRYLLSHFVRLNIWCNILITLLLFDDLWGVSTPRIRKLSFVYILFERGYWRFWTLFYHYWNGMCNFYLDRGFGLWNNWLGLRRNTSGV